MHVVHVPRKPSVRHIHLQHAAILPHCCEVQRLYGMLCTSGTTHKAPLLWHLHVLHTTRCLFQWLHVSGLTYPLNASADPEERMYVLAPSGVCLLASSATSSVGTDDTCMQCNGGYQERALRVCRLRSTSVPALPRSPSWSPHRLRQKRASPDIAFSGPKRSS